ncbi:MRG/MORF4L-binding protein-like isoform X1 [Ruditapes philippinarum]|uniref:MRG/MORF4L-binding protein-like isoform X1 n=1 Tax=Ruditapes philippinarum TaxID=129788 RepID=UPI00295B165E|nr:MRG/MORF4L-binding protein-like isoform X1 [Ruditapes philippinarum]
MSEENFNWNCEMEVNLFHALRGHKPVGVNRHFHMVSIHEKLSSTNKKITARQIWDYLGELYDLNALNESEILPFPNKELDFSLPEKDFSDVKETSFPRLIHPKQDTDKLDVKPEKTDKPEKQDKSEKADKQDKPDKGSDSGSSKSSKSDSRHSAGTPVLNTPDNSPKRKRTRNTPSSTASPATPDAPPSKRRR